MTFTSLCDSVAKAKQRGSDSGNMSAVARDGCGSSYPAAWKTINDTSTAVFEETLQCITTAATSMSPLSSLLRGLVCKTTTG